MPRRIALIPVLLGLLALVGVVAVPAQAKRNLWRQVPTWNIAHQGGEDEFPSNTLYAFRRALALNPDDTRAHYNLADTLDELGRIGEAAPHWQAYLRRDAASQWAAHARKRLAAAS